MIYLSNLSTFSALGISGEVCDCGFCKTPRMCNRVTNPCDMNIFSRERVDSVIVL